MSKPPKRELTAERLRELLSYDPDSGLFTRLKQTAPHKGLAGSIAGCLNDHGYVLISVESHQYRAHRLAWLYMTGSWPEHEVDHINGQRDDNRWCNLRDVPRTINGQNKRRAQRNSRTGLLGACWVTRDQTFVARIKVDGRYRSRGAFDSAEQAHQAYGDAKRRLHAGCTI